MATLDDLRTSLRKPRFDDDELDAAEDKLLQGYLNAAETYVKDSVGCDDDFAVADGNAALMDVAVLAIAGAYYQNPVAVQSGSAPVVVDIVSNNLIGKLRARWEVSQDGTTGDTGTA
ncbi:head-tail connector protein [Lacticaseibacillus parakribbianus]|uniref:head-tail connector protein n=1 Tax=Lacticaseibacillus parakribbianus TaxID=2970927 RepID=UPI0021CB7734|nr:head-tail connector protein [Lacticaseibacillus parakribbianus]